MRFREIGLGVAALVVAGCAVDVGTVVVGVGCAGVGCVTEPADVRVSVTDCDEDVGVYGESVDRVSFSGTAGGASFSFDNVLDGTRCVQAFLDLDTDGTLSSGDIIPSAALALDDNGDGDPDADDDVIEDENEIPVEVEKDGSTSVQVILDTVHP